MLQNQKVTSVKRSRYPSPAVLCSAAPLLPHISFLACPLHHPTPAAQNLQGFLLPLNPTAPEVALHPVQLIPLGPQPGF